MSLWQSLFVIALTMKAKVLLCVKNKYTNGLLPCLKHVLNFTKIVRLTLSKNSSTFFILKSPMTRSFSYLSYLHNV